MFGGQFALDLIVVDDAVLFEVDQQHLAWLQPPLARDLFLGYRQHSGLRGQDQMIVVRDDVACRPQAIAGNPLMDPERRAFYEYHAALMQARDGPAAIAFTDAAQISGSVERNGLRPVRD